MSSADARPPLGSSFADRVARLHEPILVLGASGFVGARLFHRLLDAGADVWGTACGLPAWRLEGAPPERVAACDLLAESSLEELLDSIRPRTVFDLVAYGAYSFERDPERIYRTNVTLPARLGEALLERRVKAWVHAGSSSEYGRHASGAREAGPTSPNSHYSASKLAAAGILQYLGRERGLPCLNLRLFSVYGPGEDAARLIPQVLLEGLEGRLPPFVDPEIGRDFVYVDDVAEAFVDAALGLRPELWGESLNVGTGRCTTIDEVAETARRLFAIEAEPEFRLPAREWDLKSWYANPERARNAIGWEARTDFEAGLRRMAAWIESLPDRERYRQASKAHGLDPRHSVSAIAACYRDAEAIPVLVERLHAVFAELGLDYEIILVNDGSPDDSEEVIRELSSRDPRLIGITHSRNFGSQAAFLSGLEVATKQGCVLLDGDLQDPPELIADFVARWREGFDVVYGRRVAREAPWHLRLAYRAFYRLFALFSYVEVPRDAGDFSLLDRKVVESILRFPERDLFLRGLRAWVGFAQTGVDYVRPERPFGRSTNNLWRNIGWAKKGILSFSHAPLNALSTLGVLCVAGFSGLALLQIVAKLLFPAMAPAGLTTVILVGLFFGSINLFAISLVGEYVAKIFDEVKGRPRFLRRHLIRDGTIRPAPHLRRPGTWESP